MRLVTPTLSVLTLILSACTLHSEIASVATNPQPSMQMAASCVSAGPLSCEELAVANLEQQGCELLHRCLVGRQWGTDTKEIFTSLNSCDTAMPGSYPPLGSGSVLAATTMAVVLELDGPASHAVYVFVQRKDGWCPAAQFMAPLWMHGGYCEATIETRWSDASSIVGGHLEVYGERVCHMPLDAEELEMGVSDITEQEKHAAFFRITSDGISPASAAQALD